MNTDASRPQDLVDAPERQEQVRLAAWVTLKRTKKIIGEGAYGQRGILALTDTKLVFLASGRTQWEIDRASITKLKRPRWAMGSYITFDVQGSFYGAAFGSRGLPSLVSGSDLAIRFGGALGAATGVVGDVVAVGSMVKTANTARAWFDALSRPT
jgi:hypothetical protein